jgi:hypothetical protein
MEDDLNFSVNGRRPQFFRKRRMISISGYGIGPKFSGYGRGPQSLRMEDNLKFSGKRKQLKFSENRRLPQLNISNSFG